jgi:ribosomal protein S18 acetylase RimI-like enzyme
MLSREDLQPADAVESFGLVRVNPADAAINHYFYERVGADWNWRDRLPWSDMDWRAHVEREQLSTWLATHAGEQVGYVELEQQPEGNVQISYFGLLPDHYGKGLGGTMLSMAVEIAWSLPGTQRVWVHTCSDDHPAALANYEKRGFKCFRVENGDPTD